MLLEKVVRLFHFFQRYFSNICADSFFFFVYTRVNFHRLLSNAQNNSQASGIVELKKFFV